MDLMEAAEKGFDGAEIEALRSYCDRLGLKYSKNNNADTLRKKLQKAMGEYNETFVGDDEEADAPAAKSKAGKKEDQKLAQAMGLTNLNLRSQGKWGGRRRMIVLHRALEHDSTRPQFFAWGQLHCYVPMGVQCSIPYPIWNILQATTGKRLIRRRKVDEDGRIYFKEEWVPSQRFMYTDMGDDPETMNLPTGMIDMVQRLYALTDQFKGFSERQFRELCSRLKVDAKPDWDAADMRAAVVGACGLESGRVDLSRPEVAA